MRALFLEKFNLMPEDLQPLWDVADRALLGLWPLRQIGELCVEAPGGADGLQRGTLPFDHLQIP